MQFREQVQASGFRSRDLRSSMGRGPQNGPLHTMIPILGTSIKGPLFLETSICAFLNHAIQRVPINKP